MPGCPRASPSWELVVGGLVNNKFRSYQKRKGERGKRKEEKEKEREKVLVKID
jgi:hypothetical protein